MVGVGSFDDNKGGEGGGDDGGGDGVAGCGVVVSQQKTVHWQSQSHSSLRGNWG